VRVLEIELLQRDETLVSWSSYYITTHYLFTRFTSKRTVTNLQTPHHRFLQRHSPIIKMYLSSLIYLVGSLCLFQPISASEHALELNLPVQRYQCASWVPQVECLKSASSFSQMMLTRTMRPKAGMATPAPVVRSAAPPPTKNCGGSGMAIMDGQVQGGCVRNRPSLKATPGAAVPTTFATLTRTSSAPEETANEE
jgi:hypothetical protein